MKPSLLVLGLLAIGCSKPAAPAPDAGPDAAPVAATAPPASAVVVDAGGPPSAAARAAALADLDAGRKLSRAKDWANALKAFDRALVVMPDDARILSEVGWAAFQANRLDRAEQANARALANAKEPLVRAPILYNMGRVAEARGRPQEARKDYRASLALRDNAEVKKRLSALAFDAGSDDESLVGEALGCKESFPDVNALCRCLKGQTEALFVPESTTFTCGRRGATALGDPRLGVVEAGGDVLGERAHLLIVNEAGRVRWLVNLGSSYEPGAFGVHNEAHVSGGESRNVNGHTVAIVRSVQADVDFNMAGLERCTYDAKRETVCAISAVAGGTKCTESIPIDVKSGCGPGVEVDPKDLGESEREAIAEIRRSATSRSAKAAWTLGNDGSVTVTILSGPPDLVGRSVLHPAPLWRPTTTDKP